VFPFAPGDRNTAASFAASSGLGDAVGVGRRLLGPLAFGERFGVPAWPGNGRDTGRLPLLLRLSVAAAEAEGAAGISATSFSSAESTRA
jgi:hypothetical protein